MAHLCAIFNDTIEHQVALTYYQSGWPRVYLYQWFSTSSTGGNILSMSYCSVDKSFRKDSILWFEMQDLKKNGIQ